MRSKGVRILLVLLFGFSGSLSAQYSMGVSGLLNSPSADMQPDGMFMAGGNFLPERLTPDYFTYNTGNYFLDITFLPWVEVAYRCTLKKADHWRHQDRAVSLRLRPLKEGGWWPSVVVGSNDVFTTVQKNPLENTSVNRTFATVYGVATKHFQWGGHDFGATLGYYIPVWERSYHTGLFGGMSFSPAFLRELTLMAEYDAEVVNIGAAARLFNHLSLHVFCYDFGAVSAGLRYEFRLFDRAKK